MFLEKKLQWAVTIPASAVHPNGQHRRAIVDRLQRMVEEEEMNEEQCYYYVAPTLLRAVSPGLIVPRTGAVRFTADFDCLIFKLFRNEVIEVEVRRAESVGCEAACGPLDSVFLPAEYAPKHFQWSKPLACFVSVERPQDTIGVGSRVLVRILSVRANAGVGMALAAVLRLVKPDRPETSAT